MAETSWRAQRAIVHERAGGYCEYCRGNIHLIGQPMHVDHIDPRGGDSTDNLALACANCKQHKYTATTAADPESGEVVALFHPRRQSWNEHFEWSYDGSHILGKTPSGRATIARLDMNNVFAVSARLIWAIAGVHPPKE